MIPSKQTPKHETINYSISKSKYLFIVSVYTMFPLVRGETKNLKFIFKFEIVNPYQGYY